MPYRLAPPTKFTGSPAGLVACLDRAPDEEAIRASRLRGRSRRVARRDDHHRRPPRLTERRRRSVRHHRRDAGRSSASAACQRRGHRPRRPAGAAGIAGEPCFSPAPRRRRRPGWRGAWSARTRRSRSPTTTSVGGRPRATAGSGVHPRRGVTGRPGRPRARCGRGVVERLDRAGVRSLDHRALLAHCVHVALSRPRSTPWSTLARPSSATPAATWNNAVHFVLHVRPGADIAVVALGTDGIGGDMFTGRRWPTSPPAGGAATAAGWPLERHSPTERAVRRRCTASPLLGLRPGAPADLVVLDYPDADAADRRQPRRPLAFGMSPPTCATCSSPATTVVADRRLDPGGRAPEAASRAPLGPRLWARMDEIPPHDFEPSARR